MSSGQGVVKRDAVAWWVSLIDEWQAGPRRGHASEKGDGRVDDATLSAYDRDAKAFADDWDAQPPPSDLHAVVSQFFVPGPTADIGCGSGRDTAWLNARGYPTKGFDASEGLLAEARRRHPQIHFNTAILPGLDGIAKGSFANVLCDTVVMHLESEAITPAVQRLLAILVPRRVLSC